MKDLTQTFCLPLQRSTMGKGRTSTSTSSPGRPGLRSRDGKEGQGSTQAEAIDSPTDDLAQRSADGDAGGEDVAMDGGGSKQIADSNNKVRQDLLPFIKRIQFYN